MILSITLACTSPALVADNLTTPAPPPSTTTPGTTVPIVPSETVPPLPAESEEPPPPLPTWTFAVWMDGDNDLEVYVLHDIDELEHGGSDANVQVVTQVDRIPGYAVGDGDWTGARRYEIIEDAEDGVIKSPIVEELGEIDMGDPNELAAFLDWTATNYPSDHLALVMWNHGSGWDLAPSELISSDDTSGTEMSIAEGELTAALDAHVAEHGPIDVIAFDACNMAAWEVAHSLQDHVVAMAASEATVGGAGLQYNLALPVLRGNPAMSAVEFAGILADSAAGVGLEWTFSATDLTQLDGVSQALDDLALLALADPLLLEQVEVARSATRPGDPAYGDWVLDLGDFASQLTLSTDPGLAAAGLELATALTTAVPANYTNGPVTFAGGLSVFGDPWRNEPYTDRYMFGDGATWSQDTHWDELLAALVETYEP